MRFCKPHWDALRAAVTQRGMDHLVAKSGEEAMASMVAELGGTATKQDWDPLMAAHWAIVTRVTERVGLAALTTPDFCPLCAVQESYEHVAATYDPIPAGAVDAQHWVDSCMDAMLRHARECGLMPGVQ